MSRPRFKIFNVVGARPNMMKMDPIVAEMRRHADCHPVLRQELLKQYFRRCSADYERAYDLSPILESTQNCTFIQFLGHDNRVAGHQSSFRKAVCYPSFMPLCTEGRSVGSDDERATFVAVCGRTAGQAHVLSHSLALFEQERVAVINRAYHVDGSRTKRHKESIAILQNQIR